MFSGIGVGQEIQLRMHQNASQSILFCKNFLGEHAPRPLQEACYTRPLLNSPPLFSTCSYPSEELQWAQQTRANTDNEASRLESAVLHGQITLEPAYSQLDSRAIREWFASDTHVPFNLLMVSTVAQNLSSKWIVPTDNVAKFRWRL